MYVFNVEVVSTKNPKPAGIIAALPVMVTVEFPTVPLAMVKVDPDGFKTVEAAVTATIVPAPLFISGLVLGKLVSFAIGTKPPTSSTRSIILASIAAVVASVLSLALQVSPDVISSKVPFSYRHGNPNADANQGNAGLLEEKRCF